MEENGLFEGSGEKQRKHLDNIEEKLKLTRWSVFIMVSVAALMTIFYVYNAMRVDSLMKDIRVLEKRSKSLQIKNKSLQIKSSSLQSAERITNIAEKKLGMIPAEKKPGIIP